MKFLYSFFLFICLTTVFVSCQKVLDFENGLAKGNLMKDATGDCMPVSVNGTFKKDTLLNATNYVDVQVNITTVGNYLIKTDTLNGYSFSATGIAAIAGLNTIRLLASGRPVAPALNVFTVKFDSSKCEFNIVVTAPGVSSTAAIFTLVGSPTLCTNATQSNNFFASIPTNITNTINIKANVTTAGTYTISTSPVNGISFIATGSLSVGTNQSIVLKANGGTPAAAGSFNYALTTTSPASNCGFSILVQAVPLPASYVFDCSTPQFFGTYQAGVSTIGDSVKILVTSLSGGSYAITSNTTTASNNVIFTGLGVLPASPSPQSVTLYALGTPAAAGTFTYTITGAGVPATCTFSKTYIAPAPTGNDTLTALINNVFTEFNDTPVALSVTTSGVTLLTISGFSTSTTTDDAMSIGVSKLGNITTGSYNVNTIPLPTAVGTYTDPTGNNTFMTYFMGLPQINPLTIIIQSVSTTRVKGTFSGKFYNNSGMGPGFVTVTNGYFNVPVF